MLWQRKPGLPRPAQTDNFLYHQRGAACICLRIGKRRTKRAASMLVPKIRNPVGVPEMEREQAGMHPKNRTITEGD